MKRFLTLCALVCLPLAGQTGIRLKHGIYAEKSSSCKDAPFAVLKQWDGLGFSGAHSSHCVANVISANKLSFILDNTCVALGDGTRIPPDTEHVRLSVLSPQSFRYSRQTPSGQDTADYRWCASQ